jgi:signal transduction histidine kinase/ligand-binding sensor domain-containing protein
MVLRYVPCSFLLAVTVFLAGITSVGAATPEKDIRFRHLNTSNGLVQGTVNAIAQDKSGFLWLGTDAGLVRYDGYQSSVFTHIPANPNSLADNLIRAIFPSEKGGLWVATRDALQLYDPATNQFTRYLSEQSGEFMFRGIRQIISDGEGGIWVGTDTGLRRFFADGRRVTYRHEQSDTRTLASDDVTALARGHNGVLWIGTTVGVDRFNPVNGQFSHFKPDGRTLPDADRNYVRAMLISGEALWIGTRRGLEVWNTSGSTPLPTTVPAELSGERIKTLLEDHRGRYWVATENGVVLWDPKSATTRRYRHHTDLPHSLGDDFVYSLFQDRNCILWVGTYFGGASYVDLCRDGIEAYSERAPGSAGLSSGKVIGIASATDQRLWLATAGGGVNLLDLAKGTVRHFRHDPTNPHSLSGDDTTALAVDRDGRLWVGTRSGLNIMRGESGRFERFRLPEGRPVGNYVSMLKLDSKGGMWVGTLAGLYSIETKSMTPKRYALETPGDSGLGNNEVWAVCDTGDGFLWIGTSNGIDRLDMSKGTFKHFRPEPGNIRSLSNRVVTSFMLDQDGKLWAGTNGGLNEVIRHKDGQVEFRSYGPQDGFSNGAIKAILPGMNKDLWVSTSAGITHFDPLHRRVENFNETDGVADTDHLEGAAYRAPDGTLFFGGFSKGLTQIRPLEIKRNLIAPQVVITDFKILNQSVRQTRMASHEVLDADVAIAERAVLTYRDNMISFEFAAPQVAAAEANRYAYRLIGFNPDWIVTDATKRTATFTNLSPGDYVFEVKAANKNGVWSAEPRTVQLEILPPFWQTWPFRILMAALSLISVVTAYRMRVRRFARQQHILEAQVRERTAEVVLQKEIVEREKAEVERQKTFVELAHEALKLTQQKLVLNEKMASIGTLTAGVAHEINNPVNFAHGGAQILSDELEGFRQYILDLAGSDADARVLQALNERFDILVGRTALITEGTTRIRELVRDLRTFSRLDQAEKKTVPIAENILSTVKLVQMQYDEDTDIVCDLAVNPTLECWPARLNQVFMNLIVNACQANRQKRSGKPDASRGTLHIQTRLVDQSVHIQFADSGNGIAPEVADHMFEPFFTTKPVGEGTGLGLSIAFAIVQKHGGSIAVRSVAGQGAVFTIELPL